MSLRGFLLVVFAVPAVVGVYVLTAALTADGAPRCDGIIEEYGDAERSGPMKPGETCDLYDFSDGRSAGTRTYAQQKKAQEEDRRSDLRTGGLWFGYGAVGVIAVAHRLRPGRRRP
ncbi:hypothetical protein ACUJ8N_18445 [Streptomyces sp. ESR1.13]|uniref:hypothetical protein n=1 Tax=unclassified Streptomyces TaxID=2593676 RepID=UPI000AF9CAEC